MDRGLPMMALHGTLAMWGSSDVRRFLLLFLVLVPRHAMCGIFTNIWLLLYIPGTQKTSVFDFFEGQPPKTRPFPIKTRVIWGSRLFCVRIFVSLFAMIVLSGCLFASCLFVVV